MRFLFSFLFFLLVFSTSAISQTVITGKLLGADGNPMVYADITQVSNRSSFPRSRIKSFWVDKNGTFSFEVKSPNLYRFWFSGAYHQDFELPVYVSEPDTIRLNVQLKTYEIKENTDRVIIKVLDGWRDKEKTVPSYKNFVGMPDSTGKYKIVWEFKADTVAYKVRGVAEPNWIIHGTQFDYLVSQENGYFSVIEMQDNTQVEITLDLKKYFKANLKEPQYEFLEAPKNTLQFDKTNRDYEKRYADYVKFENEQREAGKESYEFEYDWNDDLLDFYKKAKSERDPFLRKAYLTFFMEIDFSKHWSNRNGYSYDKEFAEEVLEDFGPLSPLWSIGLYNFSKVLAKAIESDKVYDENEEEFRELKEKGSKYEKFMQVFVEDHPDSTIYDTRLALGMSWAFKYKRFELFEKYRSTLMDLYGDTRYAERVMRRYDPQKNIMAGNKIPDFKFNLLDSKETVSSQSLKGTRYLINFWATWCAPCYKKMDDLHKIYAAFEDQGFEILNISMNFKKEHLYDFREKKYPMPWLNIHLENWDTKKSPLKEFEVISIPKTILVDKNGIIEAVNPHRDALVRLLESK